MGMLVDPIARFSDWLREAEASEPNDPNAVALATVNAAGQPAVRMVLLKGLSDAGFVFYTNQQSRKADDLAANARAGLLFHWKTLRRQVRVEGAVTPVSDAEADAYFATSRPLPDRATLEAKLADVTARFEGGDVPRPLHWSGYRVAPERIEFWWDGEHRLHNRELFVRDGKGWTTSLMYP
jgi:pyridoxamine 5'-phosphate oxidase